MEPSTSSAQSAASFFYYTPDHHQHHQQQQQQQQNRQKQHGHFLTHPAHALAAHSTQLLSPTPVSPVPFPSQLIFGAANSRSLASGLTITPSASPSLFQRSRQSSEISMPDTPRLSIDSAASEMLFTPATPPLSLGSTNTPPMAHALLTPIGEHGWSLEEPTCGTISPMEIQLPGTPLDINTTSDMPVYANPIIVPSNASPAPSVSLNDNKACPALTPSASQNSSTEADYCDPRNLTYPSPMTVETEFGIEFPTMPTLCGADDEHRLLLGNELMSFKTEEKGVKAYGIDFMEELSDLDSEDDFIKDIASLSDFQSNSLGNKRTKLESFDESEACSSDDDSDQLLSPPMSTTTSRQGSETPSEARQPEMRRKAQYKKVKCEDSDNDMSEEQQIRSFKFGSQHSSPSRRDGSEKPSGIPINPNVIRRGRKQSLTEDPTKTFVCHLCGRRFRRQEHLKRHFRSLHTEEKPFSCGECGKKFSRSDNLTQHARIHGQGAILLGVLDENEIIDRQYGMQEQESQPLGIVVVDALQAASGSKDVKPSDDKRIRRKRKRADEQIA